MGYLLGEEGRTGVAGAGSGLVGATEFDITFTSCSPKQGLGGQRVLKPQHGLLPLLPTMTSVFR